MKGLRLFVLVAAVVMLATPATAITNGQVDGTSHPNVAAVVFQQGDGSFVGLCGSTLISKTVLVTTAGCADAALQTLGDGGRVWASFDPVFDPETSKLLAVTGAAMSPYFNPGGLFDQGVLLLSAPVKGIAPARLPTADQLDALTNGARFTAVGYGATTDCSSVGRCMLEFDGVRRSAGEAVSAIDGGGGIEFQMNSTATGLGGSCYGDGGGPAFIGTSNVEGAVQDGSAGFGSGESPCHSQGFGYRLDTPQARAFLRRYVSLP